MSYTIRLTPSELKQKASEILHNSQSVKRDLSELENIIGALQATFLGETASAFFREFDQASTFLEQWDDVVNSFALEIQEAANKLEAADRVIRSK